LSWRACSFGSIVDCLVAAKQNTRRAWRGTCLDHKRPLGLLMARRPTLLSFEGNNKKNKDLYTYSKFLSLDRRLRIGNCIALSLVAIPCSALGLQRAIVLCGTLRCAWEATISIKETPWACISTGVGSTSFGNPFLSFPGLWRRRSTRHKLLEPSLFF